MNSNLDITTHELMSHLTEESIAELLAAEDPVASFPEEIKHLSTCPRCQHELADTWQVLKTGLALATEDADEDREGICIDPETASMIRPYVIAAIRRYDNAERARMKSGTPFFWKRMLTVGASIAAMALIALFIWQKWPETQPPKEVVNLKWTLESSVNRSDGSALGAAREGRVVTIDPNEPFRISIQSDRPGTLTVISLSGVGELSVRSLDMEKPIGPDFLARGARREYIIVASDNSLPAVEPALAGAQSGDEIRERVERFLEASDVRWYGLEQIMVKAREEK